ncbi:MAG: hypothetical protein R2804_03040 [Cyclobacteriaceae bacterium]
MSTSLKTNNMRIPFLSFLLILISQSIFCQISLSDFKYEPTAAYPYGRPNPEAPEPIKDYKMLIGLSDCKSLTRNNEGEWRKDSVDVIWRFKYIMNGMAVQDESLKADQVHTSSIRQYDNKEGKWYVTFYSSALPSKSITAWEGGMKGEEMILYKEQKAPNGMDGFFKITFYDISEKGFNWKGEWVDKDEKFIYPTWHLFCTKRN